MQNDNNIAQAGDESKAVSVFPGVTIAVTEESRADYVEMRSSQLAALNTLLTSSDFESWDVAVRTDVQWLAATLSEEVKQLVLLLLDRI